jgi:hypothetical protein
MFFFSSEIGCLTKLDSKNKTDKTFSLMTFVSEVLDAKKIVSSPSFHFLCSSSNLFLKSDVRETKSYKSARE